MVFAEVKQVGSTVIVRFQDAPGCENDITQYLDKMEAIYKKNERFCVLYDSQNVGWIQWHYIKMQAKFMHAKEAQTKHLLACAAIVVSGSVTRGLLNTLFAIKSPACPLEVFDNMNAAKDYIRATKKKLGMAAAN